MFKSILVLTLVGTFVTPSFSCSSSSALNSCKELNENYQLFTRTKVAAGESIIGQLDIVSSLTFKTRHFLLPTSSLMSTTG